MIKFIIGGDETATLSMDARRLEIATSGGVTSKAYLSLPEARVLELLLREPGRLRTRTELIDYAWAGRPVTTGSLNQAILNLRKAFSQSSNPNEIIITEPRHGYKICATLINKSTTPSDLPLKITPTSHPPITNPQKRSRNHILMLAISLIAINTTAALAVFKFSYISSSITTTNHLYVPYKKTDNIDYFISKTLLENNKKTEQAISALNTHPPKSTKLTTPPKFIYINGALTPNNFNFFICDKKIDLPDSNCHSYMMTLDRLDHEKTD